MADKSLTDVAYEILSERYNGGNKQPMSFKDLCEVLCERTEMQGSTSEIEVHLSRFYTDLTLDGRFVIKEGNTWSLREHELYADVHIDMNDVYIDEKEQDEDLVSSSADKDDDDEDSDLDESDDSERKNEDEDENYDEDDRIESTDDDQED